METRRPTDTYIDKTLFFFAFLVGVILSYQPVALADLNCSPLLPSNCICTDVGGGNFIVECFGDGDDGDGGDGDGGGLVPIDPGDGDDGDGDGDGGGFVPIDPGDGDGDGSGDGTGGCPGDTGCCYICQDGSQVCGCWPDCGSSSCDDGGGGIGPGPDPNTCCTLCSDGSYNCGPTPDCGCGGTTDPIGPDTCCTVCSDGQLSCGDAPSCGCSTSTCCTACADGSLVCGSSPDCGAQSCPGAGGGDDICDNAGDLDECCVQCGNTVFCGDFPDCGKPDLLFCSSLPETCNSTPCCTTCPETGQQVCGSSPGCGIGSCIPTCEDKCPGVFDITQTDCSPANGPGCGPRDSAPGMCAGWEGTCSPVYAADTACIDEFGSINRCVEAYQCDLTTATPGPSPEPERCDHRDWACTGDPLTDWGGVVGDFSSIETAFEPNEICGTLTLEYDGKFCEIPATTICNEIGDATICLDVPDPQIYPSNTGMEALVEVCDPGCQTMIVPLPDICRCQLLLEGNDCLVEDLQCGTLTGEVVCGAIGTIPECVLSTQTIAQCSCETDFAGQSCTTQVAGCAVPVDGLYVCALDGTEVCEPLDPLPPQCVCELDELGGPCDATINGCSLTGPGTVTSCLPDGTAVCELTGDIPQECDCQLVEGSTCQVDFDGCFVPGTLGCDPEGNSFCDLSMNTDTDGDGVPDSCDCAPDDSNYWTITPGVNGSCDFDGDGFCSDSIAGAPNPDFCDSFDDCNDDDQLINPGAEERCDQIDHNCDGDPYSGFSIGAECTVETTCVLQGFLICDELGQSVCDLGDQSCDDQGGDGDSGDHGDGDAQGPGDGDSPGDGDADSPGDGDGESPGDSDAGSPGDSDSDDFGDDDGQTFRDISARGDGLVSCSAIHGGDRPSIPAHLLLLAVGLFALRRR